MKLISNAAHFATCFPFPIPKCTQAHISLALPSHKQIDTNSRRRSDGKDTTTGWNRKRKKGKRKGYTTYLSFPLQPTEQTNKHNMHEK